MTLWGHHSFRDLRPPRSPIRCCSAGTPARVLTQTPCNGTAPAAPCHHPSPAPISVASGSGVCPCPHPRCPCSRSCHPSTNQATSSPRLPSGFPTAARLSVHMRNLLYQQQGSVMVMDELPCSSLSSTAHRPACPFTANLLPCPNNRGPAVMLLAPILLTSAAQQSGQPVPQKKGQLQPTVPIHNSQSLERLVPSSPYIPARIVSRMWIPEHQLLSVAPDGPLSPYSGIWTFLFTRVPPSLTQLRISPVLRR
jgi:hypothetical protein